MIIAALEPSPLSSYGAGKHLRAYLGGPSKSRKTASALTLLAGKAGRVVTSPKHLHILSFDPGALRTLEELKAPPDISIYDLESLCNTEEQAATPSPGRPNTPFFDKLVAILDYLGPKIKVSKDVHAIWLSGVSAMSRGIQREIRYVYGKNAPDEMDQYRWDKLRIRCTMVLNKVHAIPAHVVWEVNVSGQEIIENGHASTKMTQLLPGQFATILPSQCEQAVSIERGIGVPGAPGQSQFNTRPGWPWMQTSRMEGRFKPTEPPDWSIITRKAGYALAEEDPKWAP